MKRNGMILLCLLILSAGCALAENAALVLPALLTGIEAEAFAGIGAQCVYIPESAQYIGDHAFAGCGQLREIHIPAAVTSIADNALESCEGVTVYGASGTEAQRFASDNGFGFVDTSASVEVERKSPAVSMPFVPVV